MWRGNGRRNMEHPISVQLINRSMVPPTPMAEHAAKLCYQATLPPLQTEEGGAVSKFVDDRLFKVSHHTTLQHQYFTFEIEGIAVGDIDYGLHECDPNYNSDQRSGRFCGEMFANPDFNQIEAYTEQFWPEVGSDKRRLVMDYVRGGIDIYQRNLGKVTALVAKYLRADRPHLSDKAIEASAPKIAQEQTRMFVPVIFPTALDFTVNLSALVAKWESAWSPAMRYVTEQMKLAVLEHHPTVDFMFNEQRRRQDEWACQMLANEGDPLVYQPRISGVELQNAKKMRQPDPALLHPVDRLHFTPELMDNNVVTLLVKEASMSLATMGQDQRHRTIRRSMPCFTGEFYLPPAVCDVVDRGEARNFFNLWKNLRDRIPPSMSMIIAPYGAVVRYDKSGSINAVLHELGKRSCWCAQEEIYELARQTRIALGQCLPEDHWLFRYLEPPCLVGGKCGEGARYCGRDLNFADISQHIPRRRV